MQAALRGADAVTGLAGGSPGAVQWLLYYKSGANPYPALDSAVFFLNLRLGAKSVHRQDKSGTRPGQLQGRIRTNSGHQRPRVAPRGRVVSKERKLLAALAVVNAVIVVIRVVRAHDVPKELRRLDIASPEISQNVFVGNARFTGYVLQNLSGNLVLDGLMLMGFLIIHEITFS